MDPKRAFAGWLDGAVLWRAFFSLALAIMLWVWVTNLEDPEMSRRFTQLPVRIVLRPPNDLIVLDQDKLPGVTAEVRGPRSVVQILNPEDLHPEIDLGGVTSPGTQEVPVRVRAPRRVRVATVTPATVAVTVDRLASKSFALEVEKQPSPASYNIARVDKATDQVTVKGPAADLGRVARVVLPVSLGDRRDTFEAQFVPEARDAANARIAGLTIEPSPVAATVVVSRTGRTVSVVANLVGAPADGYRVASTTVTPPFVVVDGAADALNQLILISTAPIDLAGQAKPFSVYDVQLQLPVDVHLVDPVMVNVQVQIERQQVRQQFSALRVAPVNVGTGLRPTITPTEVAITLSGPLDRLRQLSGSDIQVDVDLQGLGAGTYTITPRVSVPPDLQVVEQPPAVRIQLERAATPGPHPSPVREAPPQTGVLPRPFLSP